MIGRIFHVIEYHLSVSKGNSFKHILGLRNEGFPVAESRMSEVSHHQSVLRCTVIREEIHLVPDGLYQAVLQVEVRCHLDELAVWLSQVAYIDTIAGTCTALIKEHHRLILVHVDRIETHWVGGILIEENIL